jgi:branched-chain amino acid transport system permease protein
MIDLQNPRTFVRLATIVGFILVALFVAPLAGGDWMSTFGAMAIYAVVAAGLGVLYGRVGMISLCQIGLLALGTWIGARFAFATSLPFPIVILIAGTLTAVIGVLIGLSALRLTGLHLALITLMAAGAINEVLNQVRFPNGGHGFSGVLPTGSLEELQTVRRPSMAHGDTAYYRYVVIVCALMFVLAILHVSAKPGRAWAAIRESEPAALAAGVNITLYKLWAFALASFMTGVAGCLLSAYVGQPRIESFPTQASITLLATALIGGIFTFWGAIVAGAFIQVLPFLFQAKWGLNSHVLLILFGVGLLQVLLTAPGGIVVQFPKDMKNLGRLLWRLVRRPGPGKGGAPA